MKRIGEKIKNKEYNKKSCVYAIIEREYDNKIAIVATDIDVYFFLGGGIEANESEEIALRREIVEEAGYTLKDIKFLDKVSAYCYSKTNEGIDVEASIYIAKFDNKIAEPIEEDHKLLWVEPLEFMNKLHHEYQRYILNEYVELKFEN